MLETLVLIKQILGLLYTSKVTLLYLQSKMVAELLLELKVAVGLEIIIVFNYKQDLLLIHMLTALIMFNWIQVVQPIIIGELLIPKECA